MKPAAATDNAPRSPAPAVWCFAIDFSSYLPLFLPIDLLLLLSYHSFRLRALTFSHRHAVAICLAAGAADADAAADVGMIWQQQAAVPRLAYGNLTIFETAGAVLHARRAIERGAF